VVICKPLSEPLVPVWETGRIGSVELVLVTLVVKAAGNGYEIVAAPEI
jgi:hypothetical protein